jgi:hypothetical protein
MKQIICQVKIKLIIKIDKKEKHLKQLLDEVCFEKMPYDNAQLARVYPHTWQVTGDKFFRTIVQETLDYVVREMRDP